MISCYMRSPNMMLIGANKILNMTLEAECPNTIYLFKNYYADIRSVQRLASIS